MEDVSPRLNQGGGTACRTDCQSVLRKPGFSESRCRIAHRNMVMTIRASRTASQSAAPRWLRGLVCCCLVVASFGLGCTTTNSFLAVDTTLQPGNVPCRAVALWI